MFRFKHGVVAELINRAMPSRAFANAFHDGVVYANAIIFVIDGNSMHSSACRIHMQLNK